MEIEFNNSLKHQTNIEEFSELKQKSKDIEKTTQNKCVQKQQENSTEIDPTDFNVYEINIKKIMKTSKEGTQYYTYVDENDNPLNGLYFNHKNNCMDVWVKGKLALKNISNAIYIDYIIEPLIKGQTDPRFEAKTIDCNGKIDSVILDYSLLANDEKLYQEMLRQGFVINNPKYKTFFGPYFSQQLRELQKTNKKLLSHKGLGWYEYENKKIFLLDKAIGRENLNTFYEKDFSFVKGTESAYDEFMQDVILKSDTLSLALVLGLCSVVVSLLKDTTGLNVILIDMAGISSSGKTTSQKFIVSLFGCPQINNNGLFRTFNSTANADISANSGMHGVPNVIDDTSTKGYGTNWESKIYQLCSGEEKARCNADGTLREHIEGWDGSIIISSEAPLNENENFKQGAQVRLLVVEDIKWTSSAEEANRIKSTVQNNYGFIGPRFVKGLLEQYESLGIEKIMQMLEEEKTKIFNNLNKTDNFSSRVVDQLALIALTTEFANTILGYKIDKQKILAPFLKREEMQVLDRDIVAKAYDYIINTLQQSPDKVMWLYGNRDKENPPTYGFCESYTTFKIYYIFKDVMRNLLKKFNGFSQIMKGLKKRGLLVEGKSDRYTVTNPSSLEGTFYGLYYFKEQAIEKTAKNIVLYNTHLVNNPEYNGSKPNTYFEENVCLTSPKIREQAQEILKHEHLLSLNQSKVNSLPQKLVSEKISHFEPPVVCKPEEPEYDDSDLIDAIFQGTDDLD